MSTETDPQEAEQARRLRSLGTLPSATALPDPDVLWLRAQLAAGQEAAARALWGSALRRALRYGFVCAAGAWLFSSVLTTEAVGAAAWQVTVAALFEDPVRAVVTSAAAALGILAVVGGLVFGRVLVAQRLRYLGLL